MKKRKLLGMTEQLHTDLSEVARKQKLPMTVVMQALISAYGENHNWDLERQVYKQNRQTWPNMRKRVAELLAKDPNMSDADLVLATGYSLVQIEILTYTAHRRAIAYLKENPAASSISLAEGAGISLPFAKRIWDQSRGEKEISTQEKPLWGL